MTVWSPEMEEDLKRLRADGKSFSVVAKKLGVSRGAAIGKSYRLGLCQPTSAAGTPKQVERWSED